MFLDDLLYQEVKETEIKTPEDFQDLLSSLWMMCHTRYHSEIGSASTYQEITASLDRVFTSWDLMVKKLEKEKWFLVEELKTLSFKNQFLKDEKSKQIYLKGK